MIHLWSHHSLLLANLAPLGLGWKLIQKSGERLELRRSESRRLGLKWAPNEQIGGQKRSEVHIESGAWGCHVIDARSIEPSGIDIRYVISLRMSISVSWNLRRIIGECRLGKPKAVCVHLG